MIASNQFTITKINSGEKGDPGFSPVVTVTKSNGVSTIAVTDQSGTTTTDIADGTTYYTWIKYADSPTSGMSDNPSNKKYIGIAYNKTTSTESSSYSDYSWSLIQGEQGIKGEQGETGNGIESITYYYARTTTNTTPSANSVTATTMPTLDATNKYLWQKEVIEYTNDDSQTTVTLLAVYGDKGDKGADGTTLTSTVTQYALSDSNNIIPAKWESDIQVTTEEQPYLWTKVVNTYSDGKQSISYTVGSNIDSVKGYVDATASNTLETANTNAQEKADAALNSAKNYSDTLVANKATIDDLKATNANVSTLTADLTKANELIATKANLDLANVNNAWIENGTIKNAAITNAMLGSISANKLTSGTIDASKITVTNLNADNLIVGTINGKLIGSGTVDLEKLSEEVATKEYLDEVESKLQGEIDGAIETFTITTIPTLNSEPASNWETDDERKAHIGDLCYVINSEIEQDGYCYRFADVNNTYQWVLIKDSDVTKAIKDVSDLSGTVSSFKTEYTNKISEVDGGITELKTQTSSITTNLSNNYLTKDEVNSSISASANDTLTDAQKYTDTTATTTLSSANSYTDDKSSKVLESANSTAKTEASNALSDAKTFATSEATNALSDAKSYTDGKASTLQSNIDATNKIVASKVDTTTFQETVNTVTEQSSTITKLSEKVDTKADASEVTTLSNTINSVKQTADANTTSISNLTSTVSGNKIEIDKKASEIEQSVSGITSRVSSTETSITDLTKRVSTAESSIQQNADNISSKVSKDGLISEINQSAESVKINASKIEVDGTLIVGKSYVDSTAQSKADDALSSAKSYVDDVVESVTIQYALSTSQTSFIAVSGSAGTWSTTAPQYQTNAYMWQKTTIKKKDGDTTSTTTCIQGANGTTITKVELEYCVVNSGSLPTSTTAGTTVEPTDFTDNQFVYQRFHITYSDKTEARTDWILASLYSRVSTTEEAITNQTQLYYLTQYDKTPSAPTVVITQKSDATETWSISIPTPINGYTYYTCNQILNVKQVYSWSDVVKLNTDTTIANWCNSVDSTYIDGGKIYADSVTVNEINFASSSGNNIQLHNLDDINSYAEISSDGMAIFTSTADGAASKRVAKFGTTSIIGDIDNSRLEIDSDSQIMYDSQGNKMLDFETSNSESEYVESYKGLINNYILDDSDEESVYDDYGPTAGISKFNNFSFTTTKPMISFIDIYTKPMSELIGQDSSTWISLSSSYYSYVVNSDKTTTFTITSDGLMNIYNYYQTVGVYIIVRYTTTLYTSHFTIGTRKNGSANASMSYVFGNNCSASAICSHAEGYNTTASGGYSHTEGYNTTASGGYSHTEGYNTRASGSYSHAEGYDTTASGSYSHASGSLTVAKGKCQTVIGNLNSLDGNNQYIFIIGNGSGQKRKNAFTVDWGGNVVISGNITATNYKDSGWVTASLNSNFNVYNSNGSFAPKYRKIGNTVEIRGQIAPASEFAADNTKHTIFTLPNGYIPSETVYFLCQGSGSNKWLLTVDNLGTVSMSRYSSGTAYVAAKTTYWLPFQCQFFVD